MQAADNASGAIEETQTQCPQCGATIPVHKGFVTWCERCGWNLHPYELEPPRNVFEALYAKLGRRLSEGLFNELSRAPSLKPTFTWAKALAFAIAGLVHGLTLGVAVLGIALIVQGWGNCIAMAFGIVLLGIGWVLWPRLPRLSRQEQGAVVSREDFPALYRVVDRVAQALNTSSVGKIIIDDDFNAAFTQVGWKREKVLYVGLPLFAALNGQERVAILGHELAHGVNGDPARGFFVGGALDSLIRWYYLLRPDESEVSANPVIHYATKAIQLVLGGFALIWIYLLAHLMWRDSQRAEYLADALAATVGGTDAKLSALSKLHLGNSFYLLAEQAALRSGKQDLFGAFRRRVNMIPRREIERISRVEQMLASRMDATHPPTAYRIALLRAHPVREPEVVLSQSDFEQMERELATLHQPIQEQVLDKFRDRLYY